MNVNEFTFNDGVIFRARLFPSLMPVMSLASSSGSG